MLFKQNSQTGQSGQQGSTAKSAAMAAASAAPAKPLSSGTMPTTDALLARAPATMPSDIADSGKRLIVGQGIHMKGEITACDRLIVEGQVEVTLKATRMEIKPTAISRAAARSRRRT